MQLEYYYRYRLSSQGVQLVLIIYAKLVCDMLKCRIYSKFVVYSVMHNGVYSSRLLTKLYNDFVMFKDVSLHVFFILKSSSLRCGTKTLDQICLNVPNITLT